ncbi:hypothetical protein M011DRAFT_473655 [Sporormia fimetaria CBS 119925]|uniref:Uncharacterized protein n=1 Tax=Sporormia fimetaria CBS 119925 TaxID=1340428 RepID=A0A6A6VPF4_9PLEO|nr:hypothetical protein M011DRAFT_473655 [Sporormia fimetaria CBS 119925]
MAQRKPATVCFHESGSNIHFSDLTLLDIFETRIDFTHINSSNITINSSYVKINRSTINSSALNFTFINCSNVLINSITVDIVSSTISDSKIIFTVIDSSNIIINSFTINNQSSKCRFQAGPFALAPPGPTLQISEDHEVVRSATLEQRTQRALQGSIGVLLGEYWTVRFYQRFQWAVTMYHDGGPY